MKTDVWEDESAIFDPSALKAREKYGKGGHSQAEMESWVRS